MNEIDQFILTYPQSTQDLLQSLRKHIHSLCECSEKIAYGIPTFIYKKKNLVHISAYPKHIGFYPGADAIEAFIDEIKKRNYHYAKGSVQFPLDQPLPFDLVTEMTLFGQKEIDLYAK